MSSVSYVDSNSKRFYRTLRRIILNIEKRKSTEKPTTKLFLRNPIRFYTINTPYTQDAHISFFFRVYNEKRFTRLFVLTFYFIFLGHQTLKVFLRPSPCIIMRTLNVLIVYLFYAWSNTNNQYIYVKKKKINNVIILFHTLLYRKQENVS